MNILQTCVFLALFLVAVSVMWVAFYDVRVDGLQSYCLGLVGGGYTFGAFLMSRRLALRVGRKAPPSGPDPEEPR